jgi:signal transduction histidine kinase
VTEAASGRSTESVPSAGLWLATLQRLVGRAAHEVKNSLNGVAVNLEVVRSRAARPGAGADAVARFAESAGEQFDRLTAQTEALLWLAREPREPCDVAMVAASLHALLGGVMLAGHGEPVLLLEPSGDSAPTGVPGEMVRLVLGEIVLAAIEQGRPVRLRVDAGGDGARVVVCGAAPTMSLPALAPAVETLALEGGVGLERHHEALTLTFAPARR